VNWFALGALTALLIIPAFGVEPGLPSKTSIHVAFQRAIGPKNPDKEFRNPDDLAIKFLGPRERALLLGFPMDALDLDFAAAMELNPHPPMVSAMLSRTRYIDEVLLAELARGARQVVILGAGFDSRAYRFKDRLQGVRIFEVDYGPTQEYKKRRLLEIFGSVPAHVKFVAMDFNRDVLSTQLRKNGYSSGKRTLFIWEGVTMYLPATGIRSTLHTIRDNAAPGSTIVFDYLLSTHPAVNDTKSRTAKWGEPMIFGFGGNGATNFVRAEGLEVVEDFLTSDARSLRYTQREDALHHFPSLRRAF
jgi:methyltransferase (TIGR00027 family)